MPTYVKMDAKRTERVYILVTEILNTKIDVLLRKTLWSTEVTYRLEIRSLDYIERRAKRLIDISDL